MNFRLLFEKECELIGIRSPGDWADRLCELHSEAHRHYHTQNHILEMLSFLGEHGPDTAAARFTAFFHDAVYDPRAADNEERSELLWRAFSTEFGLPGPLSATVSRAILATKTHRIDGGQADDDQVAGILDADMAILAAPRPRYSEYAAQIRKEYIHFPLNEYRAGRAKVLRGFLEGKAVFLVKGELEEAARRNIEWELSVLEQGTFPAE
jgi:predicted metal-dependent HD superfamily phosphohydrolase